MDDYALYRRSGRAFATSQDFTTATDDTTLVTAKSTSYYVYIQSITCTIKTDAAQSITFEDSASSPRYVQKVTTSPGADTTWKWDFGPRGIQLTQGKNLVMNVSATGLAGHVEVVGYQSLID